MQCAVHTLQLAICDGLKGMNATKLIGIVRSRVAESEDYNPTPTPTPTSRISKLPTPTPTPNFNFDYESDSDSRLRLRLPTMGKIFFLN